MVSLHRYRSAEEAAEDGARLRGGGRGADGGGLHAHYRQCNNYEGLVADSKWRETATRQLRLHCVLLEHEAALRKYFTYVAAAEVDDSYDSRFCEVFGVGGEQAESDNLMCYAPALPTKSGRDE